jgi:thioredoxin 1
LEYDGSVLVSFSAVWCRSCRAISPELDKLAASSPGLKLARIDVDEEPELAAHYDVLGVPTVMLFRGGEPVARTTTVTSARFLAGRLGLADPDQEPGNDDRTP